MSRGPKVVLGGHWGHWCYACPHLEAIQTFRLCQPQTGTICCSSQNENYFAELQPSNQHSKLSYTD